MKKSTIAFSSKIKGAIAVCVNQALHRLTCMSAKCWIAPNDSRCRFIVFRTEMKKIASLNMTHSRGPRE